MLIKILVIAFFALLLIYAVVIMYRLFRNFEDLEEENKRIDKEFENL